LFNERDVNKALSANDVMILLMTSLPDMGKTVQHFYEFCVAGAIMLKGPIPVGRLIAIGHSSFDSGSAFRAVLKAFSLCGLIEKVDREKKEVTFNLAEAMKLSEGQLAVRILKEHPELVTEFNDAINKPDTESEAKLVELGTESTLDACAFVAA
jgi:hypothetical protein